jgi:hypothetical protein
MPGIEKALIIFPQHILKFILHSSIFIKSYSFAQDIKGIKIYVELIVAVIELVLVAIGVLDWIVTKLIWVVTIKLVLIIETLNVLVLKIGIK